MKKARRIFLSHSSKDRILAAKLARVLRKAGFNVWYSENDLIGAEQWHTEIGRALSACDWFVLLASPASCRQPRAKPWWVQREVLYALEEARYNGRFTPVLCKGATLAQLKKISWVLSQIQCVALKRDFDAGCKALIAQLVPERRR